MLVDDNQKVEIGDVLVKMPREVSKTKDITGGLPRILKYLKLVRQKILQLFQTLMVKLLFGGLHRGLRKVTVSCW